MSDAITQQLGFDVSQALEACKALDGGFASLQNRFSAVAQSLSSFNSSAAAAIANLQATTQAANNAAAALGKLGSNSGNKVVGFSGAANITQQAAQLQQAVTTITQTSATATQALQNTGNQGAQALRTASSAASDFGINFQTVSRVIATQLIVRSLYAVKEATQSAFEGFLEFSKAGSEIQTLLDQPLNKILGDVQNLSDAFNLPVLDVAKAKYEALSNGFTDTAENAQLLDAAFKFSKIGISSATEAVDLLSTALNAYGLSADEAANLSGKFFKAVDLGRFTAKDLAGSFGRVAPIANELGVSIDELLAGFSSLTVGGVKSSEAATQLRSTLASLLKPSEDMSAAFKALGVSSGEALIRTYGFQDALLAVKSTTDGSATAIAKLFPNIRALSGVFRETETGLNVFSDHLEEIRKATSEVLDKKYSIRIDTDAERVSKDLNQLKNFFTADLGKGLVESFAQLLQFIGGVDTLTTALQNFVPVLGLAVAALGVWGVSAGVAATRTALFSSEAIAASSAVGLFAASFAGIGLAALAAFAIFDTVADRTQKSFEASAKARQDETNREIQLEREKADAIANLETQNSQNTIRFINQRLAAVEKEQTAELASFKETNKQYVDDTKNAMDHVIQAREKVANDFARDAQHAEQDSVSAHKKAIDLRGQIDDGHFNFVNQRFRAQSQLFREISRSQDLARQGRRTLGGANTDVEKEAGKQAFSRAEAFARQAVSGAQQTGNLSLQVKAQKNLLDIQNQQLAAELKEEATRKTAADRLSKQAADEKASVDRLKQYQKTFADNSNLFDSKGNRLSDKDIDKNKPQAIEALRKFNEEVAKGAPIKVGDLLNFNQFAQRQLQNITPNEIKQLKVADSAFEELANNIQQGLDKHREFYIQIAPDPTALHNSDSINDLKSTVHSQIDQAGKENEAQIKAEAARKADFGVGVQKNASLGLAALDQAPTPGQILGNAFTSFPRLALQAFTSSNTTKEGPESPENPNHETYSKVQGQKDSLRDLYEQVKADPATPIIGRLSQIEILTGKIKATAPHMFDIDFSQIDASQKAFHQVADAQEAERKRQQDNFTDQNRNAARDTITRIGAPQLADQLRSDSAKRAQDQANAAAQAASSTAQAAGAAGSLYANATSATSAFQNQVSATSQIATNLQQAAQAAQAMAQGGAGGAASSGEEEDDHQAFGGHIHYRSMGGISDYFASGGQARGTDTVPAMLSPGEFVMNAKSSQKFYSQLVAMNAGKPIYRAEGGPVGGNVTFNGGINIHASPNPQATAREVMQMIRRESRRQSSLI